MQFSGGSIIPVAGRLTLNPVWNSLYSDVRQGQGMSDSAVGNACGELYVWLCVIVFNIFLVGYCWHGND